MKIILIAFILYFSIVGISVECSFWSIISQFLRRHKISLEREVYTGEINYEIPCGVSNSNSMDTKIVGGTKCGRNEFPWIASLQIKIKNEFKHNCGCSVIHQLYILTAGHCTDGINRQYLQVVAGLYNLEDINSENVQIRAVKNIYTDNYDSNIFSNDIAIIELVKPLQLIEGIIAPICIPRGNEIIYGNPIVAGWGRIGEDDEISNVCLKVELDWFDSKKCKDIYNKKGYSALTHDCQICTLSNNKDSCQGDSGGSLMFRDENNKTFAGGIVSWGAGCARPGFPGVYTETSCYTSWIMKIINNK